MSMLLISAAAFVTAVLTLFTGFGLGTLLLPALALVFALPVAVAATAVVHGLNNLFKLGLLWREVDRQVLLSFGLPALAAAPLGAWLLVSLAGHEPIATWSLAGVTGRVTPLKLVIGLLILGFAVLELVPSMDRFRAPRRWLPAGGVVSGFFGGLSGHQGAFRAAFLAPLGLAPGAWAGTQAAIASRWTWRGCWYTPPASGRRARSSGGWTGPW